MKKTIIGISIVLITYFLVNHLKSTKRQTYIFNTSYRVESEDTFRYESITNNFVSEVEKVNLKDNIIDSSYYSVLLKLNKWELIKIRFNSLFKKDYISYEIFDKRMQVGIENQ